ncbi:hypothetical protein ACKKBF_B21230 [Auxenochlorella protothecoides x Auxenochlorella symbiontica]
MDLDGKFDVLRVLQQLHASLKGAQGLVLSDAHMDKEVGHALSRLHVMHCPSPAAFLDGLQSAGELMASWPGTPCLLVDNVAAFFHLERAAGAAAGEQGASMHARALGTLRDLACAKQAVVVASKLSLFGPQQDRSTSAEGGALGHREFMPRAWQDSVTHRLLLAPAAPAKVAGPLFVATWDMPACSGRHYFDISDAGICML